MALKIKRLRNKPLELVWAMPESIRGNPRNWRKHPEAQREAIAASIDSSGWAGALLYNATTERLIDGHGRLEGADPTQPVPVLVGRWSEDQERVVLAQLDTITNMAEPDADALSALLDEIDRTDLDDNVASILADLANPSDTTPPSDGGDDSPSSNSPTNAAPTDRFTVIAQCSDEAEQETAYSLLRDAGIACRVISEVQ
ncbi:MAG: hypothetical protein AAGI54_00805 [Planctomycetota bacterium]